MKSINGKLLPAVVAATLLSVPGVGAADAYIQCPGDSDGDAVIDLAVYTGTELEGRDVACQSLTGGDGWIRMGDGKDDHYIFSFSDVTGIPQADILQIGVFRANFPAPLIRVREGQELFLSLTNVGTHQRPDLFDPHSVHYHGFPNASAIFDGLPEATISINQQATLTYYYSNVEPGTYMWHCHVEATEHMQMGMLGNLYVEPGQNLLADGTDLNGYTHNNTGDVNVAPYGNFPDTEDVDLNGNGIIDAAGHDTYVYNDGDGSTRYDVEYAIQIGGMDGEFHDASRDTQPLPFALMRDSYPMLNGRGYPDTTVAGDLLPPTPDMCGGDPVACMQASSQREDSLITATQGDMILLRLSNLAVVRHYTLTAIGVPMQVVGRGARLLRGQGQGVGDNRYYETNAVNLGGGESTDVLIDTTDVAPGTYFLYTSNLNYLSNNTEDYGGMMTEIVIN